MAKDRLAPCIHYVCKGETCKKGFKDVTHLHAGLEWYNLMPCYLRESLAVLKLWVLG